MNADLAPAKSVIYTSGEYDPRLPHENVSNGRYWLMGHDARLPKMPDRPKLVDFFRLRFSTGQQHLLQSARKARLAGCEERIVLACLLHDISVVGFIQSDHGYWGAQLVAPYVDEEIAWAIGAHQVARFFPDPAFDYEYPELYVKLFGPDFEPAPHVVRAYEEIRRHRWYGMARMITVNDLYAFDPNVTAELDDFVDIIERNFRQPEEGLGFDNSPSAHMWRTINWPTRLL